MRYADAIAFRRALEQRLKNVAQGDGGRLARDRKRVAFERLLARLLAVAPGLWLLKGGFALDLRLTDRARATKDVDINWQANEHELLDTLLDAADHDAGDFFAFAIERTRTPEDRLGGSHRYRVSVSIAGRPFETFLLDVGLVQGLTVVGQTLTTDGLLAFAGLPPVQVQAIPLELHVAEKLHAYTRTYEGGRPSTRTKDLVDLALIAELSRLDAASLHEAIATTFDRRDTHPAPNTLPPPPREWALPFRQLAEAVGVPRELTAGHAQAATMLDPVLTGKAARGLWDPRSRRWIPASGT